MHLPSRNRPNEGHLVDIGQGLSTEWSEPPTDGREPCSSLYELNGVIALCHTSPTQHRLWLQTWHGGRDLYRHTGCRSSPSHETDSSGGLCTASLTHAACRSGSRHQAGPLTARRASPSSAGFQPAHCQPQRCMPPQPHVPAAQHWGCSCATCLQPHPCCCCCCCQLGGRAWGSAA
ncbi:hypothetical protein COO60DRAFT_1533186 [Scenedesmus sp. NREL 46B-D3]|nr:hypothetical protein COO60DRAFT_1533186 [Scenedesmus sp. NREL 46B-D3]